MVRYIDGVGYGGKESEVGGIEGRWHRRTGGRKTRRKAGKKGLKKRGMKVDENQ